jgi:hypothetical protein
MIRVEEYGVGIHGRRYHYIQVVDVHGDIAGIDTHRAVTAYEQK